jgi:hypothetical protein
MDKICKTCGKSFHIKRCHYDITTYCSKVCMAEDYKTRLQGENNPHFSNADLRICKLCGKQYRSYQKARIYCSKSCADLDPERLNNMSNQRHCSRKDANQPEIVEALEKAGALVLDTSEVGSGFPDLLISYHNNLMLIEIKNPKTHGKLNSRQVEFHREWPVIVVRTPEEALRAVGAMMQDGEI